MWLIWMEWTDLYWNLSYIEASILLEVASTMEFLVYMPNKIIIVGRVKLSVDNLSL